jgi:membrane protease subunit (stomatin/prohibitin family)
MVHLKFEKWFAANLKEQLIAKGYELKFLSEKETEFGAFRGVQIESDIKVGHIYFWSSGFFNYHFYDFEKDIDLIDDTHGNYQGEDFNDLLKGLLMYV